MKKYITLIFLALAGCANPVEPVAPPISGATRWVDEPFTINEIGHNHVITAIFISTGLTIEQAEANAKKEIEDVGLDHRIITQKLFQLKTDNGIGWEIRSEVEFIFPDDAPTPVLPPNLIATIS